MRLKRIENAIDLFTTMDRLNDTQKNRERIKSGITDRRRKGERLRDLHGRSGRGASFPSVDPRFEMESVISRDRAENGDDLQASSYTHYPHPYEASANDSRHRADLRAQDAQAEPFPKGRPAKKPRKLDTSGVQDARGISHEQLRRRQTRRDLMKILSVLLCVAMIFAAVSLIKRYTTVKTIGVSGSKLYSEAQLISLSGISTGRSIFEFSESEIRRAMDSIPNIHTRSVKRIYPNRIEITVDDVFERAVIPGTNGKYTVISAEGYVLSIDDEPRGDLLEVRGLAGYGFAPGSYIADSEHNIRTVGALELIAAIDGRGYADLIRYIDLSGAICAEIGFDNGFSAVLGAVTEAPDCIDIAVNAYERFLPLYPSGGVINVFSGSSIVDFTPNDP